MDGILLLCLGANDAADSQKSENHEFGYGGNKRALPNKSKEGSKYLSLNSVCEL